ncbi:MAG: hypothetical protein R3C69_14010 [Geminicoccaceae bacterium]
MDPVVLEGEARQHHVHAELLLELGRDRDRAAAADEDGGLAPLFAERQMRVRLKAGSSMGKRMAAPEPCAWNSTLQSAGTRSLTKARKAARILCGSWSKTRRDLGRGLRRDHRLEALALIAAAHG